MDLIRDYKQDKELVKQFLREYTHVDEDGQVAPKYAEILTQIANKESRCLFVELKDLEQFNHTLTQQVIGNTLRYVEIFLEALDDILPLYKTKEPAFKDVMDVFIEQRLQISERNQRIPQNNPEGDTFQSVDASRINKNDIDGKYPPDLIRRVEVYFKPITFVFQPIREVLASSIGKLVTVRGIVTRATDIKPRITIATYTCDQCGCESFQPVTGTDYTPLSECTSAACKANKTLGKIIPQIRGSKFVKFQELKLQEHSDSVPIGHIPRSITVMAYGEITRRCTPGDHVSVSGIFLPVEKTNYRFRMNQGSSGPDTYINAHYITLMNKTEDDELDVNPLPLEEAQALLAQENFLDKLSGSIAPEIFGYEDLKKALLLLLVGGVDINPQGMKIRGSINICLMGDPGVAKSQLLGFINRLALRSQYTTGRGSSGVGLTAAVLKDPITNELVLEGGALVLADEGICCIDEFDKMMEADRTAIHEVMEQQTVSIAKAGIMTTLNARVSILAAANPAYGRYNIKTSVVDNLQLPPALLSRFDLIWLIRDQPDQDKDINLAQHITNVHRDPNLIVNENFGSIDLKLMRRFLNLCKQKNPVVPNHLTQRIVDIYLEIRNKKRDSERRESEKLGDRNKDESLFTSPRSLLAIIRLSTAFARLRLADEVSEHDVESAYELYKCSRRSIETDHVETKTARVDVMNILKELSIKSDSKLVPLDDVKETLQAQGLSPNKIEEALDELAEYESIEIRGHNVLLID